jgi:hypothetical protein
MKYLKNTKASHKFIIGLCLIFLISASCVKKMEDLNYNQKLISDKMLEQDANEGGFTLPSMQTGIVAVMTNYKYEIEALYTAANYGGYASIQYPEQNNVNLGTYGNMLTWIDWVWNDCAPKVLDQWVQMKKKGFDTKYPDLYAMSLIYKVFCGHRLVDVFGPLPYSLYGTSSDVKFDSEEESYNLFFTELTSAVAALTKAETDDPNADQIRYKKFDKSRYGGDYATWIKVANTLRLRLAMRISKVNPDKAKTEAEAAVNNSYGVLTIVQGPFEMTTGTVNPIATINEAWQEIRLNAAVSSFLGGYNDPRLPVYGKPSIYGDEIIGMRTGSIQNTGNYLGISKMNFSDNPFVKLMDASESYFLRAEGVLKGWDMGGGTAQEYYEQGIRASFAEQKVAGIEDYLNNNTATPKAFVDPVNPENSVQPLTSITIKWDESATDEQKLERIITQKWIAMYPEGYEAWAEFRRTGYPKLWPPAVNNSGGVVPEGEFIKRLPYCNAITLASQSAVTEAVNSYLNGEDSIFEPIWWDVN